MTVFTRTSLVALAVLVDLRAQPVEFNHDIRPILTKHCTACHGGVKAAGGVSFVFRDKALAIAESGKAAIVPAKSADSEMVRRIRSTDPEEVMPRPKHGPPLAADEISKIERWISEGAQWQEHWAYVPPRDTEMPTSQGNAWPTQPLDHLVLARLQAENLKPAPAAPPAEWLRRVILDLTGLPPSDAELAAFESAFATDSEAAKRTVVDRLLASPAFGERWASAWLDLARYSDTYGFEKDPHRDVWPYRDWLVDAFNTDMPYDRFTIEQLAGDLLPNPTLSQKLATAYHRNTQTNTEGGTDDEEYRVAAVIDRISNTWTTWQGTTFGCVQCHSHPYDPFHHDEFYQFAAFLNNTEDHDLDDDFPRMKVPNDPAKRDEASNLENQIITMERKLNDDGLGLASSVNDWVRFVPDETAPSHGKLAVAPDGEVRASGTLPIKNVHVVRGPLADFTAMRLAILPENDDPKKWPERGSLVTQLDAALIDSTGKKTPVVFTEVVSDQWTGSKLPTPRGNFGDFPKLQGPRWFVLVPENPVAAGQGTRLEISMKQGAATTGEQATPLRRFKLSFSKDPRWTELAKDAGRKDRHASIDGMRKTLNGIPGAMVPVMRERDPRGTRETRVFARGNRLSKENAVKPGIPALLQSSATPAPATRLDMARWLVDGKNPLTARVMANRLWAELFGIGIVETLEDFGTSGAPPSNQPLLDHLALRFQNTYHWSVKSMLREIVLSSTYGQTHRAAPELVARDPRNRLLARGPRNRLSAEMVRDQSLAVAGLLSPKMHGPPVFPPQPEGVWNSVYSGAKWKESTGEDRLRRGLYTYSKRTSGYPSFLTFDAPSRDVCCARRVSSNTPLQALVTMNDPAHIEAARAFAKRMTAHAGDLRGQLEYGVLLATQSRADAPMLEELAKLHQETAAIYRNSPALTAKLGASPEEAALVITANTILNLDSALTR